MEEMTKRQVERLRTLFTECCHGQVLMTIAVAKAEAGFEGVTSREMIIALQEIRAEK
jgi:hypothetical protein